MTRTTPTQSIPLLIANEFHRETVGILDSLFDTYKLWTLPAEKQLQLVNDLKSTCHAVATASWQTNPLIYDLPGLEVVACFGVGVDGINFSETRPRNIQVTNTPDVLNDAVADIAMALILMTQRNLINADYHVRSKEWHSRPFPLGCDLAGKTLGILGLGSIGEDIARRAQASKMKIAYHNRREKALPYKYCADLTELAEISDVLLCMLPGGEQTSKVINMDVLKALGPLGTFINVGRGTSVNEIDLIDALKDGIIATAGLDVYDNEPQVPEALLSMKNVVLLPHVGSATTETRQAMGNLVIENLLAWSTGKPLLTPVE